MPESVTSAVDTRSDGWEGAATVREARPEEFDQAIVEWQHLMSVGLRPTTNFAMRPTERAEASLESARLTFVE